MLGAFALKYDWFGKVNRFFTFVHFKNIVSLSLILFLVVFHSAFPNLIVAPFTGLGFIFLFLQLKLSKWLENCLNFLTIHSTNIWLIHMFFTAIYFKKLIYAPLNPLLILIWLLLWCVVASYIINFIYSKLEKSFL
jgi:hypothetical protein